MIDIIRKSIETARLDLRGLTVLTECGTGAYFWTPVIALMAGANVYAVVKPYGNIPATVTGDGLEEQASALDKSETLCVINDKMEAIDVADIVTNLGFVRPLDRVAIEAMKPRAVIALMYESWERRSDDIDFHACREYGIPVVETDENDPVMPVLPYMGELAWKLVQEVWPSATSALVVGNLRLCRPIRERLKQQGIQIMSKIDYGPKLIVVSDCLWKKKIIGEGGVYSVAEVAKSGATVIHISGWIDKAELMKASVKCYPANIPEFGHMTVTLGYLGAKPAIELLTLGLKAGERAVRSKRGH